MPIPQISRFDEYLWKGLNAGLREIGQAPEQRQARRLAQPLNPPHGSGPRVLIFTPRSWAYHVQVEAVLATALRMRGADTGLLTCGGGLEICDRANSWEAPPMPCRTCRSYVERSIAAFGLDSEPLLRAGPRGEWPELDEIGAGDLRGVVDEAGVPLGELVDIPTKWFLLSASSGEDPLGPLTTRRFLRSARVVAEALRSTLVRTRPDKLVLLNGLFFFESIARHIAEEQGIDVVTYERGFRPETLVFRRGAPACRYDISPYWARFEHEALSSEQQDELDEYLMTRRRKGHPIFDFWKEAAQADLGRFPGRTVCLFTNVTWDSAVLGREGGFGSIQQWLDVAIDYMKGRPDDRLMIRVHPAEVRMSGKVTRESLGAYLTQAWPSLPTNVSVIPAEDRTSSYDLMEAADVGLVLTSTVGLEMALLGKPVVVAGETHYRGKGFTTDVGSAEQFRKVMDVALSDPTALERDVEAARRYAYTFFFRAAIPFPYVREPVPGLATLCVEGPMALRKGADAWLDVICDGILYGGDFVGPDA